MAAVKRGMWIIQRWWGCERMRADPNRSPCRIRGTPASEFHAADSRIAHKRAVARDATARAGVGRHREGPRPEARLAQFQ